MLNKNQKRKFRKLGIKFHNLAGKIWRKIKNQFNSPATQNMAASLPQTTAGWKDLSKMVIVITGSSRGIGFTLAEAFLKAGASVVINGRDKQSLEDAANKLKAVSEKVLNVVADISTSEGADFLVDQTWARFKGLDVLINNAAISDPPEKKIWELNDDQWQSMMNINVSGAFYMSRAAIRRGLTHKNHVRIINVSSGIVNNGAHCLGGYTVSKTGLEGLTISIDQDCTVDAVSVVSIKPRSVRTQMTKDFFSATEYGLMDDPDVLTPIFKYAATAPAAEIMGKSLYEPAFTNNPKAEITLGMPLSLLPAIDIKPIVYDLPEGQEKSGVFMHFLQNPAGYFPSVKQALQDHLGKTETYQYPDPQYKRLRQALATGMQIDPAHITFGTGSSELIERILKIYGGNRGNIIITRPTWGSIVWPAFMKYNLQPVEVPFIGSLQEGNIRHDLDGILKAVNNHTKLIYLVNPCNPTGSAVKPEDLKRFLTQVPGHVTVMLDEAYMDFTDPDKRFHLAQEYLKLNCRVIGLRTFSKFYALSGFRVGFAYGHPEIIEYINRLSLLFNVTTISQLAAIAAWADKESQEKTYCNNKNERERIHRALMNAGIDCLPTQTNFIIFDCPLDRDKMRRDLQKQDLYLPNLDGVLASVGPNVAALTVGLPDQNDQIIEYLQKF